MVAKLHHLVTSHYVAVNLSLISQREFVLTTARKAPRNCLYDRSQRSEPYVRSQTPVGPWRMIGEQTQVKRSVTVRDGRLTDTAWRALSEQRNRRSSPASSYVFGVQIGGFRPGLGGTGPSFVPGPHFCGDMYAPSWKLKTIDESEIGIINGNICALILILCSSPQALWQHAGWPKK